MLRGYTDRIRKHIVLHAPRERVWRALSDADEFGAWFGVKLDGPIEDGAVLHGIVAPTRVDETVARMQAPYEGLPIELTVDLIEYGRVLSFRWHPHAIRRDFDYSTEATTVVVLELEDAPEGVRLTVTEWGFDRLPPGRREAAYSANEGGWNVSLAALEKYLTQGGGRQPPAAHPRTQPGY